MVHDIHIADSFDSASRSKPLVSISLNLHAALFKHLNVSAMDRPLLNRLVDYHSDCTFSTRELQHLIFEIDTLAKTCPLTPIQHHILRQLRETCELAVTQGHSVYVLCD